MCYYSSREAAEALSVSTQTIHNYVKKGLLRPHYKGIRRILRFRRTELEEFAAKYAIQLELPEKIQ